MTVGGRRSSCARALIVFCRRSLWSPTATKIAREGVKFRYPAGAKDVLAGLDLELGGGTHLAAIVGSS